MVCQDHQHHRAAKSWFDRLVNDTAGFCRLTQIGFLRLLTHPAVMQAEVKNHFEAWRAYDLLIEDERVTFWQEPESETLEDQFRSLTIAGRFSPQQWSDAYLAAFARVNDLTLVTFDSALSKLSGEDSLLLR